MIGRHILLTVILVLTYSSYCYGENDTDETTLKDYLCTGNWTDSDVKPFVFWLKIFGHFKNKTFINRLNEPISEKCATQMQMFFENLEDDNASDRWALKLLDASTKVPSGIMRLNLGGWLGDYDECLEIETESKDIRGNYCLATLLLTVPDPLDSVSDPSKIMMQKFSEQKRTFQNAYPTSSRPSLGLCIPSGCGVDDLYIFAKDINLTETNVTFECQTIDDANPPLTQGAWCTIVFFIFIILLMIFSTAYDLYYEKRAGEPKPYLKAFSVYTNGRKLFSTKTNPGELSCLHGIRVLSMTWVVIGHTLSVTLMGPLVNIVDVLKYLDSTKSMIFVSAVHSVDSFLMVTGLLVVFKFLESREKKIKFNVFLFYVHRYIRLTTAYAAVILVSSTMLKYMGSGPHWSFITKFFQGFCEKNWWSSILYLQNYINVEEWCVGQTWYLNIDWQLYLLSPVFLFPLIWKPLLGLAMMIGALVTFLIIPFYVTWVNELPALPTNLNGDITAFQNKYYLLTHTRASSWFVGALVGYAIAKVKFNKSSLKIRPNILLMIWAAVLAVISMCVFMGNEELRSKEYHKYHNAFYNSLARPAWAACVGWIVFACTTGHGGIINSFLSMPVFQVLNKFIYSIYLLHVTMLYMIIYSSKMPAYFSVFNVAYSFWGIFMWTLILSVFWVLAFESPFICLEKCFMPTIITFFVRLWRRFTRQGPPNDELQQSSEEGNSDQNSSSMRLEIAENAETVELDNTDTSNTGTPEQSPKTEKQSVDKTNIKSSKDPANTSTESTNSSSSSSRNTETTNATNSPSNAGTPESKIKSAIEKSTRSAESSNVTEAAGIKLSSITKKDVGTLTDPIDKRLSSGPRNSTSPVKKQDGATLSDSTNKRLSSGSADSPSPTKKPPTDSANKRSSTGSVDSISPSKKLIESTNSRPSSSSTDSVSPSKRKDTVKSSRVANKENLST